MREWTMDQFLTIVMINFIVINHGEAALDWCN